MRLDAIETFCAVAHSRSFKGGALILKRPTSTVSRTIADLESELEIPLFHRSTRVVTLTQAGNALYHATHADIDRLRENIRKFSLDSAEIGGEIRVTVPGVLARHKIAPILFEFAAKHPTLSINLVSTNQNLDVLGKGIDLALRYGPLPDNSLRATRLTRTEYAIAVHPDRVSELEGKLNSTNLQELLATENCVVCSPMDLWEFKSEGGQRLSLRPNRTTAVDDLELCYEAVAAGLGIGYLPKRFLDVSNGKVVELFTGRFSASNRELFAVTSPNRNRSPSLQAIIAHLKKRVQRTELRGSSRDKI